MHTSREQHAVSHTFLGVGYGRFLQPSLSICFRCTNLIAVHFDLQPPDGRLANDKPMFHSIPSYPGATNQYMTRYLHRGLHQPRYSTTIPDYCTETAGNLTRRGEWDVSLRMISHPGTTTDSCTIAKMLCKTESSTSWRAGANVRYGPAQHRNLIIPLGYYCSPAEHVQSAPQKIYSRSVYPFVRQPSLPIASSLISFHVACTS